MSIQKQKTARTPAPTDYNLIMYWSLIGKNSCIQWQIHYSWYKTPRDSYFLQILEMVGAQRDSISFAMMLFFLCSKYRITEFTAGPEEFFFMSTFPVLFITNISFISWKPHWGNFYVLSGNDGTPWGFAIYKWKLAAPLKKRIFNKSHKQYGLY